MAALADSVGEEEKKVELVAEETLAAAAAVTVAVLVAATAAVVKAAEVMVVMSVEAAAQSRRSIDRYFYSGSGRTPCSRALSRPWH